MTYKVDTEMWNIMVYFKIDYLVLLTQYRVGGKITSVKHILYRWNVRKYRFECQIWLSVNLYSKKVVVTQLPHSSKELKFKIMKFKIADTNIQPHKKEINFW